MFKLDLLKRLKYCLLLFATEKLIGRSFSGGNVELSRFHPFDQKIQREHFLDLSLPDFINTKILCDAIDPREEACIKLESRQSSINS